MTDRTVQIVETIGGLSAAGGIGAVALRLAQLWVERNRGRPSKMKDGADVVAAAAAFQEALNTAANGQIAGLTARVDGLVRELDDQRRAHAEEIAAMKAAHDEREADCDRRLAAMQGQLSQAEQRFDSLVRQLRDPTSTAPGGPLHGAIIELADGDVRVTRPPRTRKPK